jgi:hypothetical protein
MRTSETVYLNKVIRGKIQFRKCPNCDADGRELQSYDENGDPCSSENPTAERFWCEDCDGLGFIEIPS